MKGKAKEWRVRTSVRPSAKISITPQFQRYLKKHKKLGYDIYRFLLQNIGRFGTEELIEPKSGTRIKYTYTGTYSGEESMTFRAAHGKKVFYLKLIPKFMDQNYIEHYEQAETMFKALHYRVGRYKVALIRPHLVYRPAKEDKYLAVVTDFFEENDVIHLDCAGISDAQYEKYFKAECEELEKHAPRFGVADLGRHNLFYHKKSRTILFFDPA